MKHEWSQSGNHTVECLTCNAVAHTEQEFQEFNKIGCYGL